MFWTYSHRTIRCSFNKKNCESSSGVEHHLAKVGVAGSNPVFRSNTKRFQGSSGGIGRHAGLKIQWTVRSVWVQVPSRVLKGTNLFLRFVPFLFFPFTILKWAVFKVIYGSKNWFVIGWTLKICPILYHQRCLFMIISNFMLGFRYNDAQRSSIWKVALKISDNFSD